jgi:hypothetical protein
MEDDTVVDSYMNRENQVYQIERIEYGGLQSTHKGCSAVNIWIPKRNNAFGQGIETKISPVE